MATIKNPFRSPTLEEKRMILLGQREEELLHARLGQIHAEARVRLLEEEVRLLSSPKTWTQAIHQEVGMKDPEDISKTIPTGWVPRVTR